MQIVKKLGFLKDVVDQMRQKVLLCVKEPVYHAQSHFKWRISWESKLHFNFTCHCTCGKSVNKHL